MRWISDPAHAWLEVTAVELASIGAAVDDFSDCSYANLARGLYYLEEDCDAPRFISRLPRAEKLAVRNLPDEYIPNTQPHSIGRLNRIGAAAGKPRPLDSSPSCPRSTQCQRGNTRNVRQQGSRTMPDTKRPMTSKEYRKTCDKLGISIYASARVLGISLRQAQRYAAEEAAIPETVAKLLRAMVRLGTTDV
jgi:hypothetical protein